MNLPFDLSQLLHLNSNIETWNNNMHDSQSLTQWIVSNSIQRSKMCVKIIEAPTMGPLTSYAYM